MNHNIATWLAFCICSSFLPLVRGDAFPEDVSTHAKSEKTVRFQFTYEFQVKDIPAGAKQVRIWSPLPRQDLVQQAQLLKIAAPADFLTTREKIHGNPLLYCEVDLPATKPLAFKLTWLVTRQQWEKPLPDKAPALIYLQANKQVPTSGEIQNFYTNVAARPLPAVDRAQQLYQFCMDYMQYSKQGVGWGHGSVTWACASKYGNCTDYHSLFIAMSRVRQIPAKFEIGFPLHPTLDAATIKGYHCWGKFHDPDTGWWAVDISEADKRPALDRYFFGHLDARRIHFTTGRDLILEPKQQGPPLNYLIYPYVEVDGQVHRSVDHQFRYDNLKVVEAKEPRGAGVQ